MFGLLLPIMVSNAIKPSGNRSPGGNTEILHQTNQRPRKSRICWTSGKKIMYSIERRNKWFKILYIYKIKENTVPNILNRKGLTFSMNVRHECWCNMPAFSIRGKANNVRDCSFAWTECNLWNSLPRCVRDISGVKVDVFKRKLDKILAIYPDKPRCARSGNTFDTRSQIKFLIWPL